VEAEADGEAADGARFTAVAEEEAEGEERAEGGGARRATDATGGDVTERVGAVASDAAVDMAAEAEVEGVELRMRTGAGAESGR
jgi:hypothetical protein